MWTSHIQFKNIFAERSRLVCVAAPHVSCGLSSVQLPSYLCDSQAVRQHSDHPLLHESHLLTHMEPPLYPSDTNAAPLCAMKEFIQDKLSGIEGKVDGICKWLMSAYFAANDSRWHIQTGKYLTFRKYLTFFAVSNGVLTTRLT